MILFISGLGEKNNPSSLEYYICYMIKLDGKLKKTLETSKHLILSTCKPVWGVSSYNTFQQNTRGLNWIVHTSSCLTSDEDYVNAIKWNKWILTNSYRISYSRGSRKLTAHGPQWGRATWRGREHCHLLIREQDTQKLLHWPWPCLWRSLWGASMVCRRDGGGQIWRINHQALGSLWLQLDGLFQIEISKL